MIHFVSAGTVRLSLLEGKGKGEGLAHIVGSGRTHHLNPLPSNRGDVELRRVEPAPY